MIKSEWIRKCSLMGLLTLCCFALVACLSAQPNSPMVAPTPSLRAAPAPSPMAAAAPSPGVASQSEAITHNVWRPLTLKPSEAWGGPRTKLYTYVLVGGLDMKDGQLAANASPAAASTHAALIILLQAIGKFSVIKNSGDSFEVDVMQKNANQFCVPATSNNPVGLSIEMYDSNLSKSYVGYFRYMLSGNKKVASRFNRLGPFLVATTEPLNDVVEKVKRKKNIGVATPILLVDMTGKPAKAIPAYVKAFLKSVGPGVSGYKVMNSVAADFVSSLIEINMAVPFVVMTTKDMYLILSGA